MTNQTLRDQADPGWPLPDLIQAAEAHWNDAARLALLQRDLAHRTEPGAEELRRQVAARLGELPAPGPSKPRIVRRDPAALRRPPPPLTTPTPEMAAVLRLLELERASGETARREAEALRRQLAERRETEAAETFRRERDAARAEARAASERAARLAERLAFATSGRSRRDPDPAPLDPPRPTAAPSRPAADPAYAELGLCPDFPDDLLPVFERALLRHHHPDRASPEAREAATRRFQAVTRAFARIRKLRGLPG